MKYEKNLLYSYLSPITLSLFSVFGLWFFGLMLITAVDLSLSNPTTPGQFNTTSFIILGSLPLVLFLGSFILLIISFLLLRKGIGSVEVNGNQVIINRLGKSSQVIFTKDITELIYAEVSNGEGSHSELRILTSKFASKSPLVIILVLPELFKNYKSLFSELESATGLKIKNLKERHTIWGKNIVK